MSSTARFVSPLLFLAVLACADSARDAAVASAWTVRAEPLIAVGDTADTDTAVFAAVSDARLMPNGVLAVADAGASAVLLFDSTGARIAKLGRKGRGPGEFTGRIALARRGDNTVAVWDPSQTRWSEVQVGRAEIPLLADSLGDAAWLHGGVIVLGEGLVPVWAPPLLNALQDSLPEMRLGFLDETALLWVNRDAAMREWVAYAGQESFGSITLPAQFRPTQFLEHRVVGVQTDEAGFERVVVLGFERPARVIPGRGAATALPVDSLQRDELRSTLRNLVMAQEMHWAQASSYTARADSLNIELPQGISIKIINATKRGWYGAGWVRESGFTCGMFIGVAAPRGWSEGEVGCGWR